ncbi:MAG: hypothetical protein SGILL_001799, partial [Bacillariaceae sp.]
YTDSNERTRPHPSCVSSTMPEKSTDGEVEEGVGENLPSSEHQNSEVDAQELEDHAPAETNIVTQINGGDDDGPRLMEDNEGVNNHTERTIQARTQEVYLKAGVRSGSTPPPFTATQERRSMPPGLLSASNSNNDGSTEKNRSTGRPDGPGAVAVEMTGLSGASVARAQRPMAQATGRISPVDDHDVGEEFRSGSSPPQANAPTSIFSNAGTENEDSSSNLVDAEDHTQRSPYEQHHTSEETKEEEMGSNGVSVPHSAEGDIEANVSHPSDQLDDGGNMPRVIEAELVTDDDMNMEEERKQLRMQAEQDAEDRLLANTITAEAQSFDYEEEKRRTKRWKTYTLVLSGVVVVILIAVVLGVVMNNKNKDDTIAAANTTCETAFPVLDLVNATLDGDTEQRQGNFDGFCKIAYEGGFGQWFSLTGEGSRLLASTCETNEASGADTQVLVFSQSCEEAVLISYVVIMAL